MQKLTTAIQALVRKPFEAINGSILVRTVIAILFAYFILLSFRGIDYAQNNLICASETPIRCLVKELVSVVRIDNVEGFSILLIAVLYIFESQKRKQKSHYEAWQVIDAASGVETSYARIKSLQDLNRDRVSLKNIDIPNGDLENINLSGADLEFADLRGANLKNANLSFANLKGVKFSVSDIGKTTNLENANLFSADLTGANIGGANLRNANLAQARLHRTKIESYLGGERHRTHFDDKWEQVWIVVNQPKTVRSLRKVDLKFANLADVDFTGIDLRKADLRGADLTNANLSRARIMGANFQNSLLTRTRLPRTYSRALLIEGSEGANSRRYIRKRRLKRR